MHDLLCMKICGVGTNEAEKGVAQICKQNVRKVRKVEVIRSPMKDKVEQFETFFNK
jgi:hypothetical protein